MRIGFVIREGLRSFKHSRQPAIITIITISLSLLTLSFVYSGWQTLDTLLVSSRSNVDVEIFLEEGLTEIQKTKLFKKVSHYSGIQQAEYIDKETARRRFISEFGADLIGLANENPLPESVNIVFDPNWLTSEKLIEFIKFTQNINGVWEVVGQSMILFALEKYQGKVYAIALIVFAVVLFVLIVFISNTIKLSVYSRKSVIETMNLVGATKMFVKMPFIIEGIVLGFLGGVIALSVLWIIKLWIIHRLINYSFIQINLDYDFHFALLFTGMVIGLLASFRAVQSFVK